MWESSEHPVIQNFKLLFGQHYIVIVWSQYRHLKYSKIYNFKFKINKVLKKIDTSTISEVNKEKVI